MNIFKDAFKNNITEIKLTSLKDINTHDGYAYSANVVLSGKKVATITHNGDGGEPMIEYISKGKSLLDEYIKEKNIREMMFENGWDFMGSPDKIDNGSVLDTFVAEELNLRDYMKTVSKYQGKALVIVDKNDPNEFLLRNWKSSFSKLVSLGHRDNLQSQFTKIKSELTESQMILNTNLEKLGFKL